MTRSIQASRALGTGTESWVADYLAGTYWPACERRTKTGAKDKGDINTGNKRICIEVKATKEPTFTQFLAEAETERVNAGAEIGFVVYKPKGVGKSRVDRFWAAMTPETYNLIMTTSELGLTIRQIDRWQRLNIASWLQNAELWGKDAIQVKARMSKGQENPDWIITRLDIMCRLLHLAGYGLADFAQVIEEKA